jgi:integral membrane protein
MLLVFEMISRYGFGYDLWAFGPQGFLAFVEHSDVPGAMPSTGLNLSTAILVVHGWFYVVYLFADFRMWTLLRWPFLRFLIIAAGGVVPMLSFFTEARYAKLAEQQIEQEAK